MLYYATQHIIPFFFRILNKWLVLMNDLSVISNNIVKIMNESKITLDQLVEKTGLSKSTLSRVRSGKANPGLEQIYIICSSLNCSIQEICDPEYNPKESNITEDQKTFKAPVYDWNQLKNIKKGAMKSNGNIDFSHTLSNNTFILKYDNDLIFGATDNFLIVEIVDSITDNTLNILRKGDDFFLCEVKSSIEGLLVRSPGQTKWIPFKESYGIVGTVKKLIIDVSGGIK